MKKMMAMLLASVMVAGTFATTAFAYTGDDVQKNTSPPGFSNRRFPSPNRPEPLKPPLTALTR